MEDKQARLIVAIDGPAAAGKGTIAYLIARKWHLLNLDSGACYRAVAWLARAHNIGIDAAHEDAIVSLLDTQPIQFRSNALAEGPKAYVFVGGVDVTSAIREEEISRLVPIVGEMVRVRAFVNALQHQLVAQTERGVVIEGRDTGSVVFPEAQLKYFLTASLEVRAQRRHAELVDRGKAVTFEQVYSDLQERDRHDTEREYSSLRIAPGAVVIDNSSQTIEQVIEQMSAAIALFLPPLSEIQEPK